MAGYWIVRTSDTRDTEVQAAYARAWAPIAERHGARIIAGPTRVTVKEGGEVARAFIVEFESYEKALACYEDPGYLAAAALGRQASDRDVIILEGR